MRNKYFLAGDATDGSKGMNGPHRTSLTCSINRCQSLVSKPCEWIQLWVLTILIHFAFGNMRWFLRLTLVEIMLLGRYKQVGVLSMGVMELGYLNLLDIYLGLVMIICILNHMYIIVYFILYIVHSLIHNMIYNSYDIYNMIYTIYKHIIWYIHINYL